MASDSAKAISEWLTGIAALGTLFLFVYTVNQFAQRFHMSLFWAVILLLIPFLFLLLIVIATSTSFFKFTAGFVKGMKRCPHGIRKVNGHLCTQCSAEKAIQREKFAREMVERELRAKREAESKALRSAEISRISKAWLARSDSYFSMSPYKFEDAVARLFVEMGYEVHQTPYSNDGGKDAILLKDGKKYVVECKRYERERLTGRRDLQILVAAKHDVDANGAFFISTGRFARTAIEYAKENNITIYDGDHLPILVNNAFGTQSIIPPVQVMCESCGEIVLFDIFGGKTAVKRCKNSHTVLCNIRVGDLSVATTLETPVCPNHKIPMRIVRGRWRSFWGCPSYPRCEVKIPIKHLINSTNIPDEEVSYRTVATQEDASEEQIDCISVANTRQWNIWAPILKGSEGPVMSLAVPCGSKAPNKEEYRERLYDYVQGLIQADPQIARKAVDCFIEYCPSLNIFSMKEWAYQISHCDEMNLFLAEIDWERENPPRKLSDEEKLPSLSDILEMI